MIPYPLIPIYSQSGEISTPHFGEMTSPLITYFMVVLSLDLVLILIVLVALFTSFAWHIIVLLHEINPSKLQIVMYKVDVWKGIEINIQPPKLCMCAYLLNNLILILCNLMLSSVILYLPMIWLHVNKSDLITLCISITNSL